MSTTVTAKAAPQAHNANSPFMLLTLTLFMLISLGGSLGLMHLLH
jgi:hypothetical protein